MQGIQGFYSQTGVVNAVFGRYHVSAYLDPQGEISPHPQP